MHKNQLELRKGHALDSLAFLPRAPALTDAPAWTLASALRPLPSECPGTMVTGCSVFRGSEDVVLNVN